MRELTLPGRLILIPGLGSTAAVFDRQRKAFGDRLETPDFIAHEPNESISAYAERWARRLSPPGTQGGPGDGRPVFLGGVSFGGMIAQEMAMHLTPRPRAVLLISSTSTADSVSNVMQLAEVLGRFVPAGSVNKTLPLMKLAFAMREGLDDDDKNRLMQAAREVDPAMTKWAASCSVGWPGFTPPAGYPPIHRIHSRRDWVIRPPADDGGTQWVDGANHLLHMTQATTVNRFLFEKVLAHCPEADVAFPGIEDPHTTVERRVVLEGAPAGTPLV